MIRIDFSKDWVYQKAITASIVDIRLSEMISVTLPHDAMIKESRNHGNPSGAAGGYYPGFNCIYTKRFHVLESDAGKTVLLEFEGVMRSCVVFLNGNFVASHKYGYTGFYADLTPVIEFGQDNILEVKVYNGSQPADRWYSGTGIYRPVSLLIGDMVHIAEDGVKITTTEVDNDVAAVHIEILIKNKSLTRRKIQVCTQFRNAEHGLVSEQHSELTLLPQEDTVQHQTIYVREPQLWSIENPNLYDCNISLIEDGQVLDTAEEYFGIRYFCLDPVFGLRLNGKQINLRGACIHHDNGVLGAATFSRAEERRVELSKAAGFNALRISHYPISKSMLEACDRLGMLVMEETFDCWFTDKVSYPYSVDFADCWEDDVEAIIAKDYNHPSVLMYSIGNEIAENCTDIGATWNRRIANKVRRLDPTRYVTNGINPLIKRVDDMNGDINDAMTALQGCANEVVADATVRRMIRQSRDGLDLLGLNYARGAYEPEINENPNQIIFGSETYPPDIDLNWNLVKRHPAIIGDFTWTGWDYIGEAGVGIEKHGDKPAFLASWPAYLAYCGDINLIGDRRPMSYYREIVFGLRKEPYIAVQDPVFYGVKRHLTPWARENSRASWTWTGREGKPCVVEVYSDAKEVELFCNGRSLGKKPAGEKVRFRTLFEATYEPGSLYVIAYDENGNPNADFMLQTADEAAELAVEPDRTELSASGQDISFIMVSLRDQKGILNDMERRVVTVSIDGPGELLGLGTGDPFSEENFWDTKHTTYEGRLLAVVRAKQPGIICVSCACEGLQTKTVTLDAKRCVDQEHKLTLHFIDTV